MADVKYNIEVEPLKKYSVLIAVPCYGAQMGMNCATSISNLSTLFLRAGIKHAILTIGNESLIPRARNVIAARFLENEFTHLLFIDSDIEFAPEDIFMLLSMDKELIGAPYPMKGFDWNQVIEIVKKHPDIPPEQLASAAAKWPIHFFDQKYTMQPPNPVEVLELATGFMLIKKEVFEKLKEVAIPYGRGVHEADLGRSMYDFFPVQVADGRYESEDYGFCRLWRSVGGKIWLCPWISLTHWGTYGFNGNLYNAIEMLNKENLFTQKEKLNGNSSG